MNITSTKEKEKQVEKVFVNVFNGLPLRLSYEKEKKKKMFSTLKTLTR